MVSSLVTTTIVLPKDKSRLVVLGDPHGDLASVRGVIEHESRPDTVIASAGDNVGYADGPTSSECCRLLEEKGVHSVFGNHEDWLLQAGGRLAIVDHRRAQFATDRFVTNAALRWVEQLPFRIKFQFERAPDLRVTIVHSIETLQLSRSWKRGSNDLRWDYVSWKNVHEFARKEDADVVFCGHTHGTTLYSIPRKPSGQPSGQLQQLDLKQPEYAEQTLDPARCFVVDAGSLARPGYFPAEGNFGLGTYAILDLEQRSVRITSFAKS